MRFLLFVFLIFIVSCVTPFEFTTKDSNIDFIVEGRITEIDTSYISIKKSGIDTNPIIDAKVSVIENNNTEISFIYNAVSRVYLPQNTSFRAKSGGIYQLSIVFNSGKKFISEPDTVLLAESIKGFSEVFDSKKSNFEVSATFQPKNAKSNYYLFNYINYKKALYCASCRNSQLYDTEDITNCSSPFKNCNDKNSFSNLQTLYGFRCVPSAKCWNYKKIREYTLFSDEVLENGSNRIIRLIDVPLTTYESYFLEVHQSIISKKAYQYFRLLEDAGKRTGTLFDPIPPLIVGNIYEVGNENNKAIGYFLVAGQRLYGYNLERTNASNGRLVAPDNEKEFIEFITNSPPPPNGCLAPPLADCTVSDFRTNKEPKDWKN